MRLKRLMNIVRNNTLDELIEKYKDRESEPRLYQFSEGRYQLRSTESFECGYVVKEVLFKVERNKNKMLVLNLINTHSYYDGINFTPSQITVSKKALSGAKSIQETANTIIK